MIAVHLGWPESVYWWCRNTCILQWCWKFKLLLFNARILIQLYACWQQMLWCSITYTLHVLLWLSAACFPFSFLNAFVTVYLVLHFYCNLSYRILIVRFGDDSENNASISHAVLCKLQRCANTISATCQNFPKPVENGCRMAVFAERSKSKILFFTSSWQWSKTMFTDIVLLK